MHGNGRRTFLQLSLAGGQAVILATAAAGCGAKQAGAAPTGAPSAGAAGYRLPDDANAVVLRWDSRGGPAVGSDPSALVVHASGRYTARPAPGGKVRRSGQLDAAALQALLVEVLVTQRFATIAGPAIVADIEAISQRTGRLFKVMDGGETTIEVTLPDVRHKVVLASMQAAWQLFPEVEPLQRLQAVQQRLLALAETARPPA